MKIKKKQWWIVGAAAILALAGLGAAGGALWYRQALQPVDPKGMSISKIEIKSGMNAAEVAKTLKSEGIIANESAFLIYVRIHGAGSGFQAGVYSVKRSQSTGEIINHLTSGKVDEIAVTFYPGATLRPPASKNVSQTNMDVKTSLIKAGFSSIEAEQALQATYKGSILQSRPEGADLEGYVYGETYYLPASATAKQAIQRAIDELSAVVTSNRLVERFKEQGLTLHEGLTMASIVQRESKGCPGKDTCEDQRKIASVFLNRYRKGMELGADPTYQYIADKEGLERDLLYDSPYNTRRNPGLPPGPIAGPGLGALDAVADPLQTDYLYFVSGDDNVTYFSKTNAEHEANVQQHCQQKCLAL